VVSVAVDTAVNLLRVVSANAMRCLTDQSAEWRRPAPHRPLARIARRRRA